MPGRGRAREHPGHGAAGGHLDQQRGRRDRGSGALLPAWQTGARPPREDRGKRSGAKGERWVILAIAAAPVRYFGLGRAVDVEDLDRGARRARWPSRAVTISRDSCSRSSGSFSSKVGTVWRRSSTLITCQPNCDLTGLSPTVPGCDRERRLGELGHHRLAAEEAEIAAVGLGRGVGRLLLRERRRNRPRPASCLMISSACASSATRMCAAWVSSKAKPGWLFMRLVGRLQLLVGDALVDRLLDHAVAQHAVMGAGELGLDLGVLGQVLLVGLGQQQRAADHLVEQRVVDRLERHLAILLGQAWRRPPRGRSS